MVRMSVCRRAAAAVSAESCSFTRFEHERWQAAVGPYDKIFGPLTRQAAQHMTERVLSMAAPGVKDGLDCATGPGYIIEEALARGVKATDLTGVDFSAAMLLRAQERIPARGVTWLEADIQEPFTMLQSKTFSWCTCNFGVLHLARPESFFRVARQVLKPHGVFSFSVWAELAKSPVFQIPLKAVEVHGTMDVGLPGGPPFFKYSDPDVARDALIEAGFDPSTVRAELLDMELVIQQPEDLWEAFHDGTARTGALLQRQEPGAKARIQKAMMDAVTASAPDRPHTFRQPCLIVTAKVPPS
eukprot:TRINITY_DN82682_c0_g1_i1.p1 TRINITY_DN82682_c0_g1~~TRINITY_DN82682_c0_g1_i1.p1  ORF type:complete len:321 (-),score=68.86 TRINITY_DN82682_c0_g1_i1:8-907(-)